MRSIAIIVALCLFATPYIAAAQQADAEEVPMEAAIGRELLQGVRTFSKVAAHKNPTAPKPARTTPKRMLLQGRGGTGNGLGTGNGNNVNGGVRLFSDVAAHKQPAAPKLTRKSFDRQMPKRMLLQGRGGTGNGLGIGSGNAVGAGVRLFSDVAAHKQPAAPKLNRKSFERQMPKKL